jgi:hypothetical protein
MPDPESHQDLLERHEELLRGLEAVMAESRRTRRRLAILHVQVELMKSEIGGFLSRREPASPTPATSPEPEPQTPSVQSFTPELQGV